MMIFGGCLVAVGFAAMLGSGFVGFSILSLMMLEIIPFTGPPQFLSYGVFGGYWLMMLGGTLMGISWLIKELRA